MQDLLVFLAAVADHWVVLMGSVVVVGISLFERLRRNLPTWLWIVLASAFLFLATFQAWRDQFHETEKAKRGLNEAVQRAAALSAENKENDKRIAALEVSLHDEPSVTVNVPPPIVRVIPQPTPKSATNVLAANDHPVISVTRTKVAKNEHGKVTTLLVLENTGDRDAQIQLGVFILGRSETPNKISAPESLAVARGKALELTYELPLKEEGVASLERGALEIRISLTAKYRDRGKETTYFFEGQVRVDLGYLDIKRSEWGN